ncbi:MAG: hypothetical protein WC529_01310 [Candidatus Margulisiibacteriota bacterium]
MKNNSNKSAYVCPGCGNNAFIQEGMAKFKDKVTISAGKMGMIVEGGCPELDIMDATIKCSKCGVVIDL